MVNRKKSERTDSAKYLSFPGTNDLKAQIDELKSEILYRNTYLEALRKETEYYKEEGKKLKAKLTEFKEKGPSKDGIYFVHGKKLSTLVERYSEIIMQLPILDEVYKEFDYHSQNRLFRELVFQRTVVAYLKRLVAEGKMTEEEAKTDSRQKEAEEWAREKIVDDFRLHHLKKNLEKRTRKKIRIRYKQGKKIRPVTLSECLHYMVTLKPPGANQDNVTTYAYTFLILEIIETLCSEYQLKAVRHAHRTPYEVERFSSETDTQLYTRQEIADLAGVSVKTIDRDIRKRKLAVTRIGKRSVRVSSPSLIAYISFNSSSPKK